MSKSQNSKKFLKVLFTLSTVIIIIFSNSFAQEISIKTVPLATGNQFLIYPSKYLGMANLSIALDDPWLDPFVNPAKGDQLDGTYVFSLPTMYHISGNNGGAKTLSMGSLLNKDNWFGGILLSIQQLEMAKNVGGNFGFRNSQLLGEANSDNMYIFGSIGKKLPNSNTTIGASFSWAGLDAVEGVELLYPRSNRVEQYGNNVNYRLGIVNRTKENHTFEAILLHNRFNMTHDVKYFDYIYNDYIGTGSVNGRIEKNLDKSRTWGIHFGYVKPLENNFRLGGILTGNFKTHPKIPNYELMNIPRDPGNSWAYNIGIGLAKVKEDTLFGLEIIYEPIWSNTWADAAESVFSRSGRYISAGEMTIENDFRFSNIAMRFGITNDVKPIGFQLGLQLRSIRYHLEQTDYVEEFKRKQDENWFEWTASWGLMANFQSFQIRYMGRAIIGTGRPGVDNGGITLETGPADARAMSADYLIAPSGDLVLDNEFVLTHQIILAVPLGN